MSDASSPPPPQPTVQQTFAAYSGPPLDTIRSIVSTQFQVRDAFLDPNGVPTFLVDADATKDKFMHLVEQLTRGTYRGNTRNCGHAYDQSFPEATSQAVSPDDQPRAILSDCRERYCSRLLPLDGGTWSSDSPGPVQRNYLARCQSLP